MVYGILTLLLWEVFIPVAVGTIFIPVWRPVVRGTVSRLVSSWVSGQILLFAVFQLLTVPFVLQGKVMDEIAPYLKGATAALLAAALLRFVIERIRGRKPEAEAPEPATTGEKSGRSTILWAVFVLLLAVQMVMGVILTYADGDDAFYMAVATVGTSAWSLYSVNPYTGFRSGINMRYALAPFPGWITFLSNQSGIAASTVGHITFELEMILQAYGAYWLLGNVLLKKRKEYLPVYMIGMEILILFGDVSRMTPENFLLARSRQGKAALSTLVIPMIFVLLYLLIEHLQDKGRFGILSWALLACTILTGCLCSTLGAALCCLLIGTAGLCSAVMMRRFRHLPLLILVCIPCLIYAGMYVMIG